MLLRRPIRSDSAPNPGGGLPEIGNKIQAEGTATAWTTLIAQAAGSCRTSGFLDLDLLLPLRHLRRLWQVNVQYALIKLRLDFRRIGIERQGNRSAERAIAALHHVPVLILVLLVALGPRTVSNPLASVTSRSFSSTPGNSAITSIASLLSAMSIFGDSVSELNRANGVRCEKFSNVF